MRITCLIRLHPCFFRWGLAALFTGCSTFALGASRNQVENIAVIESKDGQSASIVIESDRPLKYGIQQSEVPPEVVIEFKEKVTCEKRPLSRAIISWCAR